MKTVLMVTAFLAFPSMAFAHSGTVFKTAVNYLPVILAGIPILGTFCVRLMRKVVALLRGSRNR